MWDDIIGEPEGIKSTQCAWNCSYKCFRGTRNCCYILLTTLFAPCLAFCSAINFACLAFQVCNEMALILCMYTLHTFLALCVKPHFSIFGVWVPAFELGKSIAPFSVHFSPFAWPLLADLAQKLVVCILPRSKSDISDCRTVMEGTTKTL